MSADTKQHYGIGKNEHFEPVDTEEPVTYKDSQPVTTWGGSTEPVAMTIQTLTIRKLWFERQPWASIIKFFTPYTNAYYGVVKCVDMDGETVDVDIYIKSKLSPCFWKYRWWSRKCNTKK